MHYSIIIPTYQREVDLQACVAKVVAACNTVRRSWEIVVTDDGNAQTTAKLLAPWGDAVKVIQGPSRGPAANRNFGASQARGKWLVFTDDDCLPSVSWVSAFDQARDAYPDIAVLEGRTIADRERRSLDDESPVNESGGYLWSCNFAISKRLFEQTNGFCEDFPAAAMEDIDLRLRLGSLGHTAMFVASAVVCHPYRQQKGVRFALRRNSSYAILLDRHPDLAGARPVWNALLNYTRRMKITARDVMRFGPKGVAPHMVATHLALVTELRHAFTRAALRLRMSGS